MLKKFAISVLLASAAINVVFAVPASKEGKPSVPADLFYEFKPVPDNENAIINWRRAATVEVALTDKELPATLADLVQEKILDSVPIDPFCGEPLRYSKEKRKIWSVSDDGVDDNGTGGDTRWYQRDAVWQIPEMN